jgi:hypothetical protein
VPASWPWLYKSIRIAAQKTCISPYVLRKIPKTHTHTHTYIYIIICNMLGGNCDFCYLLLGERTQRWEIHSLHWKTISLDTNRREFYTEVSVRVRTRYD